MKNIYFFLFLYAVNEKRLNEICCNNSSILLKQFTKKCRNEMSRPEVRDLADRKKKVSIVF